MLDDETSAGLPRRREENFGSRHPSRFDPTRLCPTPGQADAYDRGWVIGLLGGGLTQHEVAAAFVSGNPGLKQALLFAAAQIPDED
jgi:hypothetical protein